MVFPILIYNDTAKALAAVSISGLAFRITKKVVQETLEKKVTEKASKISQR